MLSREQLETYRRMTPGERIALSLKMTAEQWPALMSGTPAEIDRRFELLNKENDLRNQNILAKLARSTQSITEKQQ
ncbi:MAG: hypothetical protein MI725_10800 [Pirellulales bacterium]|nr:hypothetical protein [Pirellulales bacterium]